MKKSFLLPILQFFSLIITVAGIFILGSEPQSLIQCVEYDFVGAFALFGGGYLLIKFIRLEEYRQIAQTRWPRPPLPFLD